MIFFNITCYITYLYREREFLKIKVFIIDFIFSCLLKYKKN